METENMEIRTENAVAIKLPTFWTNKARAWFRQAEAQFNIRKITNDLTQYHYVIAALEADAADKVECYLDDPPSHGKYQYLKDILIREYELSDIERGDKILDLTALGDKRPSELMDMILRLNGKEPPSYLLKCVFLRALPPDVRSVVSTLPHKDLKELGRESDKVWSRSQASASFSCLTDTEDSEIHRVYKPDDKHKPTSNSQLCFYHRKFGKQARQCKPPCSWRSGNLTAPLRRQ